MDTNIRATGTLTPLRSTAVLVLVVLSLSAKDWPQWRGPQRDGISQETGLLQEWPAEGPKLRWQLQDIGSGYGAPAVVGGRIFVQSNEGLDHEFVQALSTANGRRLWRAELGKVGNPDQKPNFPAARSTPTVDGEWLYALGSDGDLAALGVADGQVRWRRHLRTDFAGQPGTWAYAESPLIDGEVLICTPGGAEATVVALNKQTGEAIWKAAVPEADEAAYASAIVVDVGGLKQYVQMLQKGLIGLEAKTGRVLWRYEQTTSRFNANIPTAVARRGQVYSAGAGTGGGLIRLQSGTDSVTMERGYFSPKLPTAIGGAVLVGDYLYGTTGQALLCVEFETGTVKWEERVLGAASLLHADSRLYLHGENGHVALVEATPAGHVVRGDFSPPGRPERIDGMEKAWAYPALADGHLYLRDHGSLWCYDVRASD